MLLRRLSISIHRGFYRSRCVWSSDGRSPIFWTHGLAFLGLPGTRGLTSPIEEFSNYDDSFEVESDSRVWPGLASPGNRESPLTTLSNGAIHVILLQQSKRIFSITTALNASLIQFISMSQPLSIHIIFPRISLVCHLVRPSPLKLWTCTLANNSLNEYKQIPIKQVPLGNAKSSRDTEDMHRYKNNF